MKYIGSLSTLREKDRWGEEENARDWQIRFVRSNKHPAERFLNLFLAGHTHLSVNY